MKVSKRLVAAACGLGVATSLIGVSVANADPTPLPGNARPLQGVGSDTTEEVMNGMADVIVDGSSNKLISSWNAKGSAGFSTRVSNPIGSDCSFSGNAGEGTYLEGRRPNGSGQGQNALRDAFIASGGAHQIFGCLDFSRSSSTPSAGNLGTLQVKALALGTDSLTFALNRATVIPRSLTKQNLIDAYHCNFGGFTSGAWKALIPQAGSGTRSSWLGKVGLTEADLAPNGSFPCVTDQADLGTRGGSNPLQEHDLRTLNTTSIAPVSVAQWVSMMGGAVSDLRGPSMLGTIKASTGTIPEVSYPIAMNTGYGNLVGTTDDFAATRTVFNVVPTSTLTGGADANANAILVFEDTNADPAVNTSLICQRTDVLQKYGFAPIATCGTGSTIN
jgi:ABC-type phosphate transport system substrate-binding protein